MLASQCLSWTCVIPSNFSRIHLRYRVLIVSLPKSLQCTKVRSHGIETSFSIARVPARQQLLRRQRFWNGSESSGFVHCVAVLISGRG